MSNPYATPLPARPDLEQQKKRAKDLLKALRTGDAQASERLRRSHPRLIHAAAGAEGELKLADAQLVVAREYGFSSWPAMKAWIEGLKRAPAPQRPFETDPQYYRDRAAGLLSFVGIGERGALRILRRHHPRFAVLSEDEARTAPFDQADAELVVAREHGLPDFAALERRLADIAEGRAGEPFRDAFEAIKARDFKGLVALLDAHPDLVGAAGANGNTLLSLAIGIGRPKMIELLLARGADPKVANNKGSNALHLVAGRGSDRGAVALTERLLAAGADTEAESHGEGGTPLAIALFWGKAPLAERLAREGVTPLNLRVAAGLGRVELLESLANPDGTLRAEAGRAREFHRPHSGFPAWRPTDTAQQILDEALTYAARNGRIAAMDWLVKHGADVNAEPCRGTPLAWAVRLDRLEAVDWLLDHGAAVGQTSGFGGVDGFTPLHLAAAWDGHPRIARRLLERGADIDALHVEYNATPASTARYFDNPDVGAVIEEFAAKT